MTVASLVEAEGRGDDMPKIARVIYNRLENPGTAGTDGLLQIDATVNYAAGQRARVAVSTEEDLQARLAVQHLRERRACRRGRSRRRATPRSPRRQPGRRRLVLLRHGQPGDRRDQVRRDLRRVPAVQAGAATTTARTSPKAPADRVAMRCAVLGDPIAHSLSPVLHRAGYAALGLDWEYDAARVSRRAGWRRSWPGSTTTWRGLSLTMPLKREALALADRVTDRAALAGAANTLVLDDGEVASPTTPTCPARRRRVRERVRRRRSATVTILGGGATAASTGLALSTSAPRTVRLLVRVAGARRGDRGRRSARTRPARRSRSARSPTDPVVGDVVVSTIPAAAQDDGAGRRAARDVPVVFEVALRPVADAARGRGRGPGPGRRARPARAPGGAPVRAVHRPGRRRSPRCATAGEAALAARQVGT